MGQAVRTLVQMYRVKECHSAATETDAASLVGLAHTLRYRPNFLPHKSPRKLRWRQYRAVDVLWCAQTRGGFEIGKVGEDAGRRRLV